MDRLQAVEVPVPGGNLNGFLALPSGGQSPGVQSGAFQSRDFQSPGVLLLDGEGGRSVLLRERAERFAAEGFAVLAPEPSAPDNDRRVVAELDAAARWLGAREDVDAERLAAVGYGVGGTQAFLFGCASTRVAAVVDVQGPIAYPELSADKPVQPLEMALNLACPLLALFGGADPAIPAEHVQRMRSSLSQFARNFDIVVLPEAGREWFDDRRETTCEADTREAWKRTLEFLREAL